MFQSLYIRQQLKQRKSVHNKYKVRIKVFLVTSQFRNPITAKYFVRIKMGGIGKGSSNISTVETSGSVICGQHVKQRSCAIPVPC